MRWSNVEKTYRWCRERSRRFVLTTLTGLILFTLLLDALPNPFSCGSDEQVAVREQIAEDLPKGGKARLIRRLFLHDAATTSYLVVIRHPPPKPKLTPWDELRIYDATGPDLELGLELRPLSLAGGVPTVHHAGIRWGNRTGRMYHFTLLATSDIGSDGSAEIIGAYRDQISSVERPFAISWNESDGRYEVSPLIASPPNVRVYLSGSLDVAHWSQRESRTGLRLGVYPNDRETKLFGATRVTVRHLASGGWILLAGHASLTRSVRTSPSAEGFRNWGSGFEWSFRHAFGISPKISLLTVDALGLRDANGKVRTVDCSEFATSPIRPGLTVPRLTANALTLSPLGPRHLHLDGRVYC